MPEDSHRPPVQPSPPPFAATAMALALAAVLASVASAVAAPLGGTAPRPDTVAPVDPFASHSQGSVTVVDGSTIGFDAYAGRITVGVDDRDEAALVRSGRDTAPENLDGPRDTGPPRAAMSYVAYLRSGADRLRRPLLFLYDGGPGSSSRGLVVASFGPVAVEVPGPGDPPGAPLRLGANPDCLLDAADLVFVDAPGTGFGAVHGAGAAARFYGIDADADAFARFVERFLALYGRAGSPLFLFGHSYGTVRSAVLARRLTEDDVDPAGIVAISQWLDNDDFIDSGVADPGTDEPYMFALPTYAATAWYFHRVSDRSRALDAVVADAERFATHDYAEALLAGTDLAPDARNAVARHLEALTGIDAGIWIASRLRVSGDAFRHLVLGDRLRTVGRLDTRYVGALAAPWPAPGDAGDDPFSARTSPEIAAAMARYSRDTLGVGPNLPFTPFADVPNLAWNNDHVTTGKPWQTFFNVEPDLAGAMLAAPGMRVLVAGGEFDLSTTFFAAIEEMKRLPLPPGFDDRWSFALYPTGHEPYLEPAIRRSLHDRIARFIRGDPPPDGGGR